MAEAIQSARGLGVDWRVWRPSPQIAFALRLGVGSSAAIWIGNAPGLAENHPTWILITVLMLMQPTVGASLMKSLLRAIGTIAAAFTAILLFGLFSQDPPLLMAGLFVVQVVAVYGFSGARFQYAWFVWAFTTAIVLGDAMAGQNAVETAAFQRASMIGIGVLIVFVVDSLIWPARAESSLRASLASRALALGKMLRGVIASPIEELSPEAKSAAGALASQLKLVGAARSELGVSDSELDILQRLAIQLEAVETYAQILATPITLPSESESDVSERQAPASASIELGRRIEAALQEVAIAIRESSPVTPYARDLEQAYLDVESLEEGRAAQVGPSASLAGRAASLRNLVALLKDVSSLLSNSEGASVAPAALPSLRFRPDPFRVKTALRGGVAVILTLLIVQILGWPMNTMVAPIAFMVSASPTRGALSKTVAQLVLVLAVSWLVGDLFIVYVMPHLGRAPLALLVPFGIGAAFGYVGTRVPQLALLPSIGAMITLLSLFGSTGAPMDVYGSYSTICYAGLAVGVATLCSQALWPSTAAGLFRVRLSNHLAMWREAVRELGERETLEPRRAIELFHTSVGNSTSLGALHEQARSEPPERALDDSRRASILSLAMSLIETAMTSRGMSDAASSDPRAGEGTAGPRLRALQLALETEQEALLASMQNTVEVLRGESAYCASGLTSAHQVVLDRAQELRADPVELPDGGDPRMRRFLAYLDVRRKLVSRGRAIEDWLAEWYSAEQSQIALSHGRGAGDNLPRSS